jgi:hypothetical protein
MIFGEKQKCLKDQDEAKFRQILSHKVFFAQGPI